MSRKRSTSRGAKHFASASASPTRRDVVVQAEEVVRIVPRLDLGQALIVLPAEAGHDPVLAFVADEVEVHGTARPGPEVSADLPYPPRRLLVVRGILPHREG